MNVTRAKLVGTALALTVWLFWPAIHSRSLSGDDVEYLWQSKRRRPSLALSAESEGGYPVTYVTERPLVAGWAVVQT